MNFTYFLLILGFVIFFVLPAIFVLVTAETCTKIVETQASLSLAYYKRLPSEKGGIQALKIEADLFSWLDKMAKLFRKIEIVGLCLFVLLVIFSIAFAVLGKVNAMHCFFPEILGGFLFCFLSIAANLASLRRI